MSVINQMLKDLEENKQNTVQATPVASIAPSRSGKLVMILLMLLITGLAVVAVYLFAEKLQRQDTTSVSPAVVPVKTSQDNAIATQPDLLQQALKAESENTLVSAAIPASAAISASVIEAKETTETSVPIAKSKVPVVEAKESVAERKEPATKTAAPVSKTSVSAVVPEPAGQVTRISETKTEPAQVHKATKIAAEKVSMVAASAADMSSNVPVAAEDSFAIKPVLRSKKEQAARYYKQASDALLAGDTLQAKKYLAKILRLDKHHDQAREKLASLLYGEQRYADAVKLLQQGLANSPHYPNFRLMLARIYLQNNDKQQAYYYLKPLQPEVRENLDYYAMLAGLAQSLGDLEQAKAAYLQLTKYDGNRAKWWLGLGISADKLQDQALALQAYKQAQSMGQLSPASRRYINDRIKQLENY